VRLGARTAVTLALAAPSLAVAQSGSLSTVSGVVFDSLSRAPLARADVQLVLDRAPGDSLRAFFADANEHGAFRIDSVPPGSYLLTFFHPRLDSLGISVAPRRVVIGANKAVRADLGTPSHARLIGSICSAKDVSDTTGLLIGFVRDAATLTARSAASLSIRWGELVFERKRITPSAREVTVTTTEAGWFGVCGVPARIEFSARAAEGSDTSGYITVELPGRQVVHRDFFIGHAERVPFTVTDSLASDSTPTTLGNVLRGTATLAGQVRDQNGRPVAGAHVTVWGTAVRTVTSDSGAFSLAGLPPGTHTLDVRALGFVPSREGVDILDVTRTNRRSVRLASLKSVLDTIRVTGRVAYSADSRGFERRRRAGFGHFIDRTMIDRRPMAYTSDLLRMVPSVQVMPGPFGQRVYMRSLTGSFCRPDLYIDGMRYPGEVGDIDELTAPLEVSGIEVYTRASQAPVEFSRFQSGCGSVIIWTRKPEPKPRRGKEQKQN
jgi:hypothetical protein